MQTIYIGIGTNLGDRLRNLEKALELIKEYASVEKISSIYETPPFGFEASTNFYNIVIQVQSHLCPESLLQANQQTELALGRIYHNDGKYHSRVIDLDILLFEDLVFEKENLKIPHPHISKRNFVLLPLLEIAPEISVPGNNNLMYREFLDSSMHASINKVENRALIPY
ncbi:MAG: 2-amino-4-hydroxy-6-hydroxymethyldihydropteridine diphosphokinase [Crocinitomicaceae bacterium]|nr:2-amino-4-hydroxy-6-hydroxymethyldihydropteridine diphosphokinase [Crocinitomicaceae bacterium]